jgi:hypothetical protein
MLEGDNVRLALGYEDLEGASRRLCHMGSYTSNPPLPAKLGSNSSLLQYTPILLQELLLDHISAYLLTRTG